MLKIIFAGAAEFAAPSLQNLLKNKKCQIMAVITQPDRPAGRGLELQKSPIKKFACTSEPMCSPAHRSENMGGYAGPPIQIMQPQKIIEIKKQIKKLNPDLLIVCAYGEILPPEILAIPRLGAINLHASILPKYRGASPIQAAILNNDKYSGISIIQMDEKLDHGPLISQMLLEIAADETGGSLHDKLADLGARLLEFTLDKINQKSKIKNQNENLKIKNFEFYNPPAVQNDKQVTYTKKLNRGDGLIQPGIESAIKIERKARAYNPWPGTYLKVKSEKLKVKSENQKFKILKIHQVAIIETTRRIVSAINKKNTTSRVSILNRLTPGDLFVWNNQLVLKCRADYLVLQKVQIPGKKIISGEEFARGYIKNSNS